MLRTFETALSVYKLSTFSMSRNLQPSYQRILEDLRFLALIASTVYLMMMDNLETDCTMVILSNF